VSDTDGEKSRSWIKPFARGLLRFSAVCVTLMLWLWAVGALYFMEYLPTLIGIILAAALLADPIVAHLRLSDRRRTVRRILLAVAVVVIAFLFVRPSNDREWVKDQAVLSSGVVSESRVSLSNIRHVILDSSGDISKVSHFDRTYELDELKRIWYGVEYFTRMKSFAHTFITFEFSGGQDEHFLTFSIEVRREKGESFGMLSGMYRRFELMYVVSKEREMIENRLATSEDRFYLYPIRATEESRLTLLVDMIERMNRLQTEPEFYNTITSNCTNNIVWHLNRVSEKRVNPYDLRIIFPGFSDGLAYNLDLIDTDLSFDQTKKKFRIDLRGRDLVGSENFSNEIRKVP